MTLRLEWCVQTPRMPGAVRVGRVRDGASSGALGECSPAGDSPTSASRTQGLNAFLSV